MSVNHVARIVPVIKVNNRNLNQDFYSKTLGMKSLLEEGAQLSLGDQTKTERLILEESPSMRSRRVKGAKPCWLEGLKLTVYIVGRTVMLLKRLPQKAIASCSTRKRI